MREPASRLIVEAFSSALPRAWPSPSPPATPSASRLFRFPIRKWLLSYQMKIQRDSSILKYVSVLHSYLLNLICYSFHQIN